MIMGDRVRYRLGGGGLIGVGLLALATLPGCSPGQAAEELVPNEAANIAAPPAPSVVGAFDSDSELLDPEDPFAGPAPENAPKAEALPTNPASQEFAPDKGLDFRSDPIAPSLEAPAEASPSKTGTSSPDERIQRLEERFDALLKELRESKSPPVGILPRSAQNKDPNSGKPSAAQNFYRTMPSKSGTVPTSRNDFQIDHKSNTSEVYVKKPHRTDGETEQVNLTRATYKLPAGRTQAIATFLTQNLNDEIEVRVKGDGLQVTASAEDQTVIAQFIRLLQTRGAAEPKTSSTQQLPDVRFSAPTSGDNKPVEPKGF